LEQTDEIIAACPSKSLHKALFSATIPTGVEQLARSVMNDALRVIIGTKDSATELVKQELVYAGTEEGKLFALRQLITSGSFAAPCLVFVQSIVRAKALFSELSNLPIKVDVMHSDMPKRQRDEVVQKFRDGQTWILICTDVLSRGIDVLGIKLVINYDFPTGTMSYIHRIGRTGRAGRTGRSITYFTNDDREYLSM
jgi:ATP-dependent RNA helicase DDX52/ROK1